MKSLTDLQETTLLWQQTKTMQRSFVLTQGQDIYATLDFNSPFGTLAVAESAEGIWTYKRMGAFRPRISIRIKDIEQDIAIYTPKLWADGTLEFKEKDILLWNHLSLWHNEWAFSTREGKVLLTFRPAPRESLSDLFKFQLTVQIQDKVPHQEKLPILLTLGMYLMILQHQDSQIMTSVSANQ